MYDNDSTWQCGETSEVYGQKHERMGRAGFIPFATDVAATPSPAAGTTYDARVMLPISSSMRCATSLLRSVRSIVWLNSFLYACSDTWHQASARDPNEQIQNNNNADGGPPPSSQTAFLGL